DPPQALRADAPRFDRGRRGGRPRGRPGEALLRRALGRPDRDPGSPRRAEHAETRRLLRRGRTDDGHAPDRFGARADTVGGRELRPRDVRRVHPAAVLRLSRPRTRLRRAGSKPRADTSSTTVSRRPPVRRWISATSLPAPVARGTLSRRPTPGPCPTVSPRKARSSCLW